MAYIPPTTNAVVNPQLLGVIGNLPMPTGGAGALASGTPFTLIPGMTASIGGSTGQPFTITDGAAPAAPTSGSGQIVVGGGSTPAPGAQPAAPGSAQTPATPITTPSTPAPAAETDTSTGVEAAAAPVTGFSRAERSKPMVASVDGAKFSFPSFKASAKSDKAPAITWGPGWKRVEKNGMWYMQHSNGTKAIPAVEYRITPSPADALSTVKVANGWGKKFPDGSILVFDRTEGPYRLDPQGKKHKVGTGTQTIGGVKVRIFEASVVRTLEPNGAVTVFTSRGQTNAGTTRGRLAPAGAAATGGGGKDQLPVSAGGTAEVGPPAKGGGAGEVQTTAQLSQHVQNIDAAARALLAQVQSGTLDPAALQSLQAQLSTLPSGLLQSIGAAGTMTTNGAQPASPSSVGGVQGGGANDTAAAPAAAGAPPVANRDVQAEAVKTLAAGTKATLASAVPADLVGKQARFGQLPAEVQLAIAKAYGSDQGAVAFEADAMISFPTKDSVQVVESEKVYLHHVPQVRGAGPGEDLALTVRPTRQPGSTARSASTAQAVAPASASTRPPAGAPSTASTAPVNGGGGVTANRIVVFGDGVKVQSAAFAGIEGSFTWKSLPAVAKAAILDWLKANPNSTEAKSFASREGSGWMMEPGTTIVVSGGSATFVDGLDIVRAATGASTTGGGGTGTTPAPAPSGPTTMPVGHNATQPPAGSGTGTGSSVRPPTAPPPAPAIPGGTGDHSHVGH